jgi:glycosyltransferase involved in cell wall biosynthesis
MNIDILIPVASKSNYIKDALLSAVNQIFESKKIYIIENNSGDEEFSFYLKTLAKEYNVEYVFYEQRLPMFQNWNRCLKVGQSEWITFLHDDDIFSPNYLENITKIDCKKDLIFYSYNYFHDYPIFHDNSENKIQLIKFNNREELLANVINSSEHISSTIFRRDLNINFPIDFKMIGDQYALRDCIAKHKDIEVLWVKTAHSNQIRNHPNQITWNGSLNYAANENAISYFDFFKIISSETIIINQFCNGLIKFQSNVSLNRIMSALLFKSPIKLTSTSIIMIFIKKKSIKLIITVFLRAILQKTIWNFKTINFKVK